VEVYHQVLAVEPENLEAKIGLSEVLYWSGNSTAAAAILNGVPGDKLDDQAKLMLADLLIAKKDYQPAIRIFTAYLEKKPDDWSVRLKLADVQSWTKQYPEAIANYEAILKAHPNDRQVRRKYGMALSWAGQNEKAAEQLRRSLND
jgi:thioredoxin-like negative regulator of GroEL